jgi:hypothetical protein
MAIIDDLNDAVVQHYARKQEGLPPPLEPHPGYATLIEAWIAHRKWLSETFPLPLPRPVRPDSPPEG